ncbi:WD40-repeat-containing domain protein [Zychaea mexicana]|uniref:WD40-repeat-containing domain protein n=1 Tax=Zychaea mexicana TaxID=64656 RepID=UPI0022FE45E4|nr:WD40-repeat-containing domain protein [Zychaea mexicana]KAI9494432.1 WD40-repeat-containing domain protein [Zychaea mexicana]
MASSRSIIWSPHPDSNRFLVSGTELKLYEWIPATSDTPGSAHFISNIPKIALVMCADWSPDPYQRDLIAVGLTTGRTVLVRMQNDINLDSPYPSSADGPISSNAGYRNTARNNITSAAANNNNNATIASKQYPVLGVKMSRPCNVVSFSQSHPHLLACGLDKVRNDPCLLVWDVSQALDGYSAADTPTGMPGTPNLTERSRMNSFGMDTSTPYPSSTYREQRPIQQYGSSEAIASCAWSTNGGSPLLIAGMGYKYLRAYDIRVDSNSIPLQFSTKAVYGATVDPFNPYRLATYNEEGVIRLWDLRQTNDSVLTLNSETNSSGSNSSKHSLSKIAFSPTRPGLLASLSRDSTSVNLWDIQETCTLHSALAPTTFTTTNASTTDSATYNNNTASNVSGFKTITALAGSNYPDTHDNSALHYHHHHQQQQQHAKADDAGFASVGVPVLWRSRESAASSKPITTFNFIPNMHSLDDPHGQRSTVPSILAMHRDGQFEGIDLEEASKMTWRPTGGMMVTNGSELLSCGGINSNNNNNSTCRQANIFERHNNMHGELAKLNITDERARSQSNETYVPTYDVHELRCLPVEVTGAVAESLANDISVIMHKRVKMGYSMEYQKNISVVKGDHKLSELWSWIRGADELARTGNVDYSYQGVYSIWNGLDTGMSQNRKSSSMSKNFNTMRGPPPYDQESARRNTGNKLKNSNATATATTASEREGGALFMVSTQKRAQRELALKVCGFDYTQSELEQELVRLESRGDYDQATGWAFFCGLTNRAIEALGSGRGSGHDEQQRKLMSAVMAGFQPGAAAVNPTWRELCESLSQDMVNRPYLRVIFAYISSNDWYRVLDEPRLSLKERIAVALRVLDDEQSIPRKIYRTGH